MSVDVLPSIQLFIERGNRASGVSFFLFVTIDDKEEKQT